MQDEIFDRSYQAGRAQLNAGIDRAFAKIRRTLSDSFKVQHRLEWSAPWAANSKNVGRA